MLTRLSMASAGPEAFAKGFVELKGAGSTATTKPYGALAGGGGSSPRRLSSGAM